VSVVCVELLLWLFVCDSWVCDVLVELGVGPVVDPCVSSVRVVEVSSWNPTVIKERGSLLGRSFVHSFICPFVCRSFICLVYSFVRSFIYSYVHSFIRMLVPLLVVVHPFIRI